MYMYIVSFAESQMASTPSMFGPTFGGFTLNPLDIPYPDNQVFVDYVFVTNSLIHAMMKTKILDFQPKTVKDVPFWDNSLFDTMEEIDPRPEQTLRPQRMYSSPFRKGKNSIVLCDYVLNGVPQVMNKRVSCVETLTKVGREDCWFGFEQEYVICSNAGVPLGWEDPGKPDNQMGGQYAGVNHGFTPGYERLISETHARACVYAGIKMSGFNKEKSAGMWEYQIGPSDGLKCADDLVMSRHLLQMVAEIFGVKIIFKPKPFEKSLFSIGLHLYFSTRDMRADGGMKYIQEAIEKLSTVPQDKLLKYYDLHDGKDNVHRLIGDFFVTSVNTFSYTIVDEFACSLSSRKVTGKGFFEDRRPSSDANPYMVIEAFVKTLLLDEPI